MSPESPLIVLSIDSGLIRSTEIVYSCTDPTVVVSKNYSLSAKGMSLPHREKH